jgi:hypothetical protein
VSIATPATHTRTAPDPAKATATSAPVNPAVPTAGIETFTPEYCGYVLDNFNRNPRRLRRDKAAQYAADMTNGDWAIGAGTILFDIDGWLVDGQHRFAACVLANRAFTSAVIRGVAQDAVDNSDRGLKRAVADILRGAGEVNVTALQSAINMGCRWDERGPLSNWVPTWSQMDKWLTDNPGIRQAVVSSLSSIHPPLSVRGSVMAPFVYRIRQIDPAACESFMAKFGTGVDLQPGDAILKLRDLFLRRSAQVYGRPTRVHDLALLVKTWNAHVTGRPVRILKWNRGGGTRQESFPFLVDEDNQPWPFADYVRAAERAAAEGEPVGALLVDTDDD